MSMNLKRALWAAECVVAFSRRTDVNNGPEAMRDLICDLGHYAQHLGLDFEYEVKRAVETWREEKSDPLDNGKYPL